MNAPSGVTPHDWLAEFPPPRSLSLDQEALRIYERAYAIGVETESEEEPPISFSTVMLALLEGEDETSRWFAREALDIGPNVDAVRMEKQYWASATPQAVGQGRPSALRLSSDQQLLTASARSVLETAEDWAIRVGGSDIGVRHLLAAYVINPPAAHRRQIVLEWHIKEVAWREAFFAWIEPRYTAEAWADASQRAVPTKAVASFEKFNETQAVKGEAVAFPGDDRVMAVLARAARFHARRKASFLGLTTVLFALVDEARHNDGVRAAISPVWPTLATTDAFMSELDVFIAGPEPQHVPSFDDCNLSARLLNGLATARELALAIGKDASRVGALHLFAALISRRVDNDVDLASKGLDGAVLRQQLIDYAESAGENPDTWRDALGEEEVAPTSRAVDLNSDEPEAAIRADAEWGSDPLGIRPDVRSFAALLASRKLEPPLSIGLFGPWGSGKTTFLKRLRRVVDERAAEARQDGIASQYVGNVVHVEFNAWHFAEDALVSSLVDAIVRELRAFIKDEHPEIGRQLLDLRAKTAEAMRRAVDEAKKKEGEARDSVEASARAAIDAEARARQSAVSLGNVLGNVWAATVAALRTSEEVKRSGVLDQIGAVVQSTEDLQQRVAVIRSRSAPMLTALGWGRTLGFVATVLILPPLVAWFVHDAVGIEGLPQALSTVAAVLAPIALWVRAASGAAAKVEKALAAVLNKYEESSRNDVGVQRAKQALAAAEKDAAQASAALAVAERAQRWAQDAAKEASLPSQMLGLASSRADDATYAKDLTTISIARGDLLTLSRILLDQSRDAPSAAQASGAAASALRPVDRVILYVDDLDRCDRRQVVRVLQVVHMLLAFELFVIVVAVDARWVEESLQESFPWLGSAHETAQADQKAGPVTPQDYLEKIFQISFWLEPMTAGRAAAYLKSLARPRASGRSGTGLEGFGGIDIGTQELDYMRALAAYVGPSPRRVKRLVNAYRLLKARLSDAQLKTFITDRSIDGGAMRSGPYQLVIGLLIIGTGVPANGARILKDLSERDPRDIFKDVIDAYRKHGQPDWMTAASVLETLARTQRAKDISELRGWARQVGRFLLQGQR
jgi:hypothetical protein